MKSNSICRSRPSAVIERRAEAARGDVKRHVPGVIEPRRQREPRACRRSASTAAAFRRCPSRPRRADQAISRVASGLSSKVTTGWLASRYRILHMHLEPITRARQRACAAAMGNAGSSMILAPSAFARAIFSFICRSRSGGFPCHIVTSAMTRTGSRERYESVGLPGNFLSVRFGSFMIGPDGSTT